MDCIYWHFALEEGCNSFFRLATNCAPESIKFLFCLYMSSLDFLCLQSWSHCMKIHLKFSWNFLQHFYHALKNYQSLFGAMFLVITILLHVGGSTVLTVRVTVCWSVPHLKWIWPCHRSLPHFLSSLRFYVAWIWCVIMPTM